VIDVALTKSIRAKQAEAAYLTRVLDLWAAAEAQGIDSSGGGAFGFDTRLLTPKQKHEWQQYNGRFVKRDATGANHPKLFNYFRYPDGRTVILYPMLEAVHRE